MTAAFVLRLCEEIERTRRKREPKADAVPTPTFRVVRRVWRQETLFVEPVAPAPKTRVSGSPRMTAAMRKQQQRRELAAARLKAHHLKLYARDNFALVVITVLPGGENWLGQTSMRVTGWGDKRKRSGGVRNLTVCLESFKRFLAEMGRPFVVRESGGDHE